MSAIQQENKCRAWMDLNCRLSDVGDCSVAIDNNTEAFLVVDGSSSPIRVSELYTGQSADVYGSYSNGCFAADITIAY